MQRFDFEWWLRVWRELKGCAEEVVYFLVVPPAGGNGPKDIDAAVDEFESLAKSEAPLNIALKSCL